MNFTRKNGSGILVCLAIAIPAWLLGKTFPVVGGAIIAIIAGIIEIYDYYGNGCNWIKQ